MGSITFTHVPAEAFIGFRRELATEVWATINISAYAGPNQTPLQPLLEAPQLILGKIQLLWSLERLALARAGAGSAKDRDRDWDTSQKRLRARLDLAAMDDDPAKRAAAERLQQTMLSGGGGEAQTQLAYQQEVDFGRQQLEQAASGQVAADIALLDLGSTMEDIHQSTEALAMAIGHGQDNQRPSERLRKATAKCISTCTMVLTQLAWLMDNGQAGADRARAAKLYESLESLARRYPGPRATAPAPDDEPTPSDDGDGSNV